MAACPDTIVDGDLLAAVLEAAPGMYQIAVGFYLDGTAQLVYELSLGTVDTRWQ